MRNVILAAVVPFLFCGCGGCGCFRPPAPEKPEIDSVLAAEIKLPEAAGAEALDKGLEHKIFLLVNEQGKVLLVPDDQYKGAEGDTVTTLDNPAQVEVFLKRRAKEDRDGAGPAGKDKPLRSTVILRVHKDCPFEKTSAIMKAACKAEYTKFQWRASRGADGEGQISVTVAESNKKPEMEFVARATADGKGKLEKITLRGAGIDGDLDLKTDTEALGKSLADFAAKNKGKKLGLQLEIGAEMLQGDVIKLIDAAVRAGFADVWPVPFTRYTVRVTSTENGAIANITIHGDGLPAGGLDLKADVREYSKKLKELAAKHDDKSKPAAIDMEIGAKLLQAHVVQLIDTSIRAGFTDVSPIPLDPKQR